MKISSVKRREKREKKTKNLYKHTHTFVHSRNVRRKKRFLEPHHALRHSWIYFSEHINNVTKLTLCRRSFCYLCSLSLSHPRSRSLHREKCCCHMVFGNSFRFVILKNVQSLLKYEIVKDENHKQSPKFITFCSRSVPLHAVPRVYP